MKIKVKTSAIFYGIVAQDNLTERNNTTYAGKFLKNVIAYLFAGRQALWFSKTCGSGFSAIPAIYPPVITANSPSPKTETCAIFRLCKAPGAGLAWFTRIRPMLSSLPRGALIPVKPTPQALLHVSIGMCGELKGSCRGGRWCKLVGLVAYPSSSSSSSSSHMPCFLEELLELALLPLPP